VGMERSDVGSEQVVGRYSVGMERSMWDLGKLGGDKAWVVIWAVGKLGGDIAWGMGRSDVGSEQVRGDLTWVFSVVMWTINKKEGDIARLWSVVMWAVSKWGRFSLGMERSDVGSQQVVGYSVGMLRCDVGSEQVGAIERGYGA
jgi:hypothetical protein